MNKLNAGTELSYSAGRSIMDPYAYRVVRPSSGRISSVLSVFPQLKDLFIDKPPLIISCYPASLGSFDNAIMVDTYLRPEAVTRALLLAARENLTAILAGQPLAIAEFLLGHIQSSFQLPRFLLFSLGGYFCPRSLEKFLVDLANDSGCKAAALYAYGVAEVEYGCMMGVERTELGEVIYLI